MVSRKQIFHAAATILSKCLAVPVGAEIVVFGDETTIDCASVLAETAIKLDLRPIFLYFTSDMQRWLGGKGLSPAVEASLKEATATLICLNGTPQCLPFRENVRQTAWTSGCKVAHMPGVDTRTLLLADVDYGLMNAHCEFLALALAKGKQIEIITRDRAGKEHRLNSRLEPWIRLPIISDGIIHKGAWDNVPSGEIYIAPPEGVAEGSIVIDGSLPGYWIRPGEEMVLVFREGRLVEWTPRKGPATTHLQNSQIDYALSCSDPNWSNLAEIGLGVNPRVSLLTGNPLRDEKKYGSIHIALGDNIDMGGKIASCIHCDMVCLSPKVLIDGKTIIDHGEIVLDSREWREDYRATELPNSWHSGLKVKATATEAFVDEQGQLRRLWDTDAGRVCSVPVGNNKTATTAASIYQLINRTGQPVTLSDLAHQQPGLDLNEVLQLSYLLSSYGLISRYSGTSL